MTSPSGGIVWTRFFVAGTGDGCCHELNNSAVGNEQLDIH